MDESSYRHRAWWNDPEDARAVYDEDPGAPAAPADDDRAGTRPLRLWFAWIADADGFVLLDPDTISRVRRQLGAASIHEIANRALEAWVLHLRRREDAYDEDDEELRRWLPSRELYLDDGEWCGRARVDQDMLDEIWRRTEMGDVADVLGTALAFFARQLEEPERVEAELYPPGVAPARARALAVRCEDPMPAWEARDAIRAWLAR